MVQVGQQQIVTNNKTGDSENWNMLKGPTRRFSSPNVTVSQDGTGNFRTIMEAVLAAPNFGQEQHVIFVTSGVYREYVNVYAHKWNLVMIGEGMHLTVVSGNRSFADGWKTFHSATFAVEGQGFIAMNLGFENTAGPRKHQAFALQSSADRTAFFRCKISSYPDTLSPQQPPILIRNARSHARRTSSGYSKAVFQSRLILARRNDIGRKNTITASRQTQQPTSLGSPSKFACFGAQRFGAVYEENTTYIGRPWGMFSRTIFMQTYLSNVVAPEGWLQWNEVLVLILCFMQSIRIDDWVQVLGGRVKWPSFHVLTNSSMASEFTVAEFIQGNLWLPSTGIPYIRGLAD